jgi:hypothetical protein
MAPDIWTFCFLKDVFQMCGQLEKNIMLPPQSNSTEINMRYYMLCQVQCCC